MIFVDGGRRPVGTYALIALPELLQEDALCQKDPLLFGRMKRSRMVYVQRVSLQMESLKPNGQKGTSMKPNPPAEAAKAIAEARRRNERNGWIITACMGWGLFIATAFYYGNLGVWSTKPAPPMTPWYVTTKAYVAKDGTWRSIDTGERITVTHWTTKDY